MLFFISISLLISVPYILCVALVPRLDGLPPSSGGVFPPPSGEAFLPSSGKNLTFNVTQVGEDTFYFDGYIIHNCGTPGNASSKARQVLGYIFQLQRTLELVVADIQQGTRSQHGFAAFFKSDSNVRSVRSAFRTILKAKLIYISEERAAAYRGPRSRPPAFICINEGDAKLADTLAECKEETKGPLAIWPGTEILALCPETFNRTLHPFATQDCPTLDRNGKFRPGDTSLTNGLFAKMVYNLVTMYYKKMYETYEDWNVLRDMQYAVELNAKHSLLNRESYGYYVGAVQGGCTEFPKTKGMNDELRL